MSGSKSLPVLLPTLPDQRWSCHSCGYCCRHLVVHVSPQEREQIDQQGWSKKLGVVPYVKTGRSWALNKRDDGACVFLDEHTRCKIHSELGQENKPLACRMFPFSVRPVVNGWQASLRFDCPSAVESKGEPIRRHQNELQQLVGHLGHPGIKEDFTKLSKNLHATQEEMTAVNNRIVQWFETSVDNQPSEANELSLTQRILGAARITTVLLSAKYKQVRNERFVELLDIVCSTLPSECYSPHESPTHKQLGMLRQLVFAHAEHVNLSQIRAGFFSRMQKRKQQLRNARLFLTGQGIVPTLPGFAGEPTFAQMDSVQPLQDQKDAVDSLLQRYLLTRITSQSVFGDGYYNWNIFQGLSALWLSLAVIGWLSRYGAACDGRNILNLDDVTRAIGVVDRAATRLPALGTITERARISYLSMDDGIARLWNTYSTH